MSENYKIQDPERMAYLEIINKLIQLINPEKFVELERLQVDKSLAMIQQMEMYKRQNQQAELALAKETQQVLTDRKMQEKMLELITEQREKELQAGSGNSKETTRVPTPQVDD